MQYSMNTIVRNIINNDTSADWQKMYNLALDLVAKSARGQRKIRILNAVPSSIKNCEILDRLKVEDIEGITFISYYIAGQDYHREMSILRDIFDLKKNKI